MCRCRTGGKTDLEAGWEHRAGQCEADVSGRCLGSAGGLDPARVVPAADGSDRSRSVALERDRGEKRERGKADWGLSAHWALLSSLQLSAYGQSISTNQKNRLPLKKKREKKKQAVKVPQAVWEQVGQTEKCVTPPLTGDTVKRLCIYDPPQVMMGSAAHLLSVCTCITMFYYELQCTSMIVTWLELEQHTYRFSIGKKENSSRWLKFGSIELVGARKENGEAFVLRPTSSVLLP